MTYNIQSDGGSVIGSVTVPDPSPPAIAGAVAAPLAIAEGVSVSVAPLGSAWVVSWLDQRVTLVPSDG